MDRERKRRSTGFEIRTDLALEERECAGKEAGELLGVRCREWELEESQIRCWMKPGPRLWESRWEPI